MKRIKKSWMALLLGVLLLGVLVGVVWAGPKSHHGGFHYTATIPGGHFNAVNDAGYDWASGLWIEVGSGYGLFHAMVPMLPGNRTVESMTLHVRDQNGSNNAVAKLYRVKMDGTQQEMAGIGSTGSASGVRSFTDTSISPNKVWGGHGAYIWLEIWGPDIDVIGVQVKYY